MFHSIDVSVAKWVLRAFHHLALFACYNGHEIRFTAVMVQSCLSYTPVESISKIGTICCQKQWWNSAEGKHVFGSLLQFAAFLEAQLPTEIRFRHFVILKLIFLPGLIWSSLIFMLVWSCDWFYYCYMSDTLQFEVWVFLLKICCH